jgi:hypothetical protein
MSSSPYSQQRPSYEAGAGIQVRKSELDKSTQEAINKSLFRYAYSPLEEIPLADRELGMTKVFCGRLTLVDNYSYQVPNMSDDYIFKNNGLPFIVHTKSAYDCADEIVNSYNVDGLPLVTMIRALTGLQPETVREIERVIMPVLPGSLREVIDYLQSTSPSNVAKAGMPAELQKVATDALQEMTEHAISCVRAANLYLDKTEREFINSRKPNGHGKSNLDERDRRYYAALKRPVPKESDLEYAAAKEVAEAAPQDNAAMLKLFETIAEKLGTAAPVADPKVTELEAKLAAQSELIQQLIDAQPKPKGK